MTLEEYEAREERWNMETATRVAAALYFVMAVKDRKWFMEDVEAFKWESEDLKFSQD